MDAKKFIRSFALVILALIVLFAGTVFLIDPLFQYHSPWFGLQPVITNERYQNAGIAKHFEFENALIGNSMSENFHASWFESEWGNTVKLTASGSYPLDWTYLLELLESRKNAPERIVIQFAPGDLSASPEVLRHEMPLYLYNDNLSDDVEYLLNSEILFQFTIPTIASNLNDTVPDMDDAFLWDVSEHEHRKEAVLNGFFEERKEDSDDNAQIDLQNNARINIELLIPYIQAMPDTEFVFWVCPFSILFWYGVYYDGNLGQYKEAYLQAIEKLLNNQNVTVLFWNDEGMRNIVTNLDNYKDSQHYLPDVSYQIFQRIVNTEGKLDKDSFLTTVEAYFDFIENYPFNELLAG